MTLFSRSCHDPFNADVHCCESFQLFFDIHDKSCYQWRFKCNSEINQVQLLAGHPITGHMTSSQVTKIFTSITPHRIGLQPWEMCHCVCLVKTHRMMCNMIYLGHSSGQVIWPDLRSNFQIDLSGSRCICFDASWREEYDGPSCFSLSFFVQRL